MKSDDTVESMMSDKRWNPFWFLRCCTNIGKKPIAGWQVWDFRNIWYPSERSGDRLIVPDADTAVEACRLALATLEAGRATE